MTRRFTRLAAPVVVLSLGLAACSHDAAINTSLYSTKEPVVERQSFTLDLAASADGLSIAEQKRLSEWFGALGLGYGDRIALDDAIQSAAVRDQVATIAGHHGLLLQEGPPVTQGFVSPGHVRVAITRSHAHVPGCPDWSNQYRTTLTNLQSPGFGCAVNSNLAAMVADPEHLLEGAKSSGETLVMTSNRAIDAYRKLPPSASEGLPAISTNQNTGGN